MLPALAAEFAAFALFAFALAFRRFFVCGAPSICGLKSFGRPRRDIIHVFLLFYSASSKYFTVFVYVMCVCFVYSL